MIAKNKHKKCLKKYLDSARHAFCTNSPEELAGLVNLPHLSLDQSIADIAPPNVHLRPPAVTCLYQRLASHVIADNADNGDNCWSFTWFWYM